MPMHYPPLANGTYRYGDQPQPKPSPVPGPDPSAPTALHHGPAFQGALEMNRSGQPQLAGQGPGEFPTPAGPGTGIPAGGVPGHGAPPEDTPTEKRRPNGTLAAVAIVGGLAIVVVAVLGFLVAGIGSNTGTTTDPLRGPFALTDPLPGRAPATGVFTVDGTFTVASSPGEPVSGDSVGCDMPASLSDIGEGTTLTLLESSTGLATDAMLVYDGGDLSSCTFTFEFPDVSPGGTIYMIELPGRGQLVYTEDELRAGVDISLGR